MALTRPGPRIFPECCAIAETTWVGRSDRAAMAAEIKEHRRELGSGQVTGGAT
jgi:hypothetical protein